MRYALALMACSCLFGQGTPIYTTVGPLSCGLRLYSPGQVQEYCIYAPAGATPLTVCNAVHQITPVAVGASLPVAASQSCFATDVNAGQNYEVTWLVWEPIVALPPNSTGSVQYQIASTQQACTLNSNGACVANAGAAPVSNLQSGSFQSGVQGVALGVQVGGNPPITWAYSPRAEWAFDYSLGPPAISAVSTSNFAQAVGDWGMCTVTTSGPGIAQFDWTAEGIAVAWIPNGSCGGSVTPPALRGNCRVLGLSAAGASGSCRWRPVKSARFLVEALLDQLDLAPVVQGQ